MEDLTKIAQILAETKYLERTPYLTSEELKEILLIISIITGKTWRLVQHINIESKETWNELDLQEWDENTAETLE